VNNLREFIQILGDKEAATLFEEKQRTVKAWRTGQNRPRAHVAQKIVRITASHEHGPVTFNGIYGEF